MVEAKHQALIRPQTASTRTEHKGVAVNFDFQKDDLT